ncbi:MAG: glycosyltransferase family 2 protein [Anaerolineales bacterium]
MATFVADIELSATLPTLGPLNGAQSVLALVRWQGRPIGLIRVEAEGDHALPAQLMVAIASQVARPRHLTTPPTGTFQPVSVVVCTHERPDDLARCLDALAPIARAGHEVLVVDNAPRTGRTAELVARYPFRYLGEQERGLNRARNLGLRAARHAIVAYTDDDTVPDPNWANALAQAFASPEVGCVTGLVFPIELETQAQELFETYCAHRRTFEQQVLVAPHVQPAAAGVAGMGANMAFRRDLLLRLGGFDPRLDGGTATRSGGDTDMFARVLETGAQIVYTPDALVWHRHRREMAQLRSCLFGYGVGLYGFLTKRLVEAHDLQASIIAARWLIGPFVKAVQRRMRGQSALPLSLLLVEASGAFFGPMSFWRETRRHNQWQQPIVALTSEEVVPNYPRG